MRKRHGEWKRALGPPSLPDVVPALDCTVRRLGPSAGLARSLTCTNAVESMISVVQRLCGRVTNWKGPRMTRRWAGAGMLEAERSFGRIWGCQDMPAFTAKIRAEVARRRDQAGNGARNAVA